MNDTFFLVGNAIVWPTAAALATYELAKASILVTTIHQGTIVVMMVGDGVWRYVGRIDGHWVHPETGKIYRNDDSEPKPKCMPRSIFGIYLLGPWPYFGKYRYEHPRNKYVKKSGVTDYEFVPREGEVDSLYFQASYGIVIHGAETSEKLPLTLHILITTQTTDAATSLFKNMSPGWLARVTAAVQAAVRDFVGNRTLDDITRLEAESSGSLPGESPAQPGQPAPSTDQKNAHKSAFQRAIDLLNDRNNGNPGLDETVGQRIIAVNFLSYSIDTTSSDPAQKASLAAYFAQQEAAKKLIEAKNLEETAKPLAAKTRIDADAKAYQIEKEGTASADAADKMARAVAKNPHAGNMAIAEAIRNQTGAKTLIIGASVMPTISADEPPEKPKEAPEKPKTGGKQ